MSYAGREASLVINNTEQADAGRYRCEADNRVARVETEATLTVQSKPHVVKRQGVGSGVAQLY